MHWNGGRVEAHHHHVSRVLHAQYTYPTDFFLKLWHQSIVKCIYITFRKTMLAQVVKNVHDNIFVLCQIKS